MSASKICEIFLALIGVVFFSFIQLPEEKENVYEIVSARKVYLEKVYAVRILLASLSMAAVTSICIFILKLLGGQFESFEFIYGTYVNAMYLGGISMFVGSLFNQSILGFLAALIYSMLEMSNKGEFTKYLNIYSLGIGDLMEKNKLFFISIVLIVVSLFIYKLKEKVR